MTPESVWATTCSIPISPHTANAPISTQGNTDRPTSLTCRPNAQHAAMLT